MIETVTIPPGKRGPWTVERFTIGEAEMKAAGVMRLAIAGRGVRPGTYTRLLHGREIIMSDTPAEQRDHLGFVAAARDHVLISGLGIGMCLAAVLKKPEVTRVTVVEISADLIALVGPHYTTDPRVEIVCASIFDYRPPRGARYGAVWHDIWETIAGSNVEEMRLLRRRFARRAKWQGCWCEYESRLYALRDRRWAL